MKRAVRSGMFWCGMQLIYFRSFRSIQFHPIIRGKWERMNGKELIELHSASEMKLNAAGIAHHSSFIFVSFYSTQWISFACACCRSLSIFNQFHCGVSAIQLMKWKERSECWRVTPFIQQQFNSPFPLRFRIKWLNELRIKIKWVSGKI